MKRHSLSNLIIAGPCAAESRDVVINCALEMKKRNVFTIRTSLWKPRTEPGWDGVHDVGIPWLKEIVKMGMIVATEVLEPDNVVSIARQLDGHDHQLILWIGARNQNHSTQIGIAKKMMELLPNARLMLKNQPWVNEKHWLGIVKHIEATGFPMKKIILCHRGFAPNGHNPAGLRNIPDWDMAMRVKNSTGLPMLLDPSHIGGSVENVIKMVGQAKNYDFDGMIVVVHPDPSSAKTDALQQLSIHNFDELLKQID